MSKCLDAGQAQGFVGPDMGPNESGSFRPWVVSAESFRPGSFRPNFWGESIRPILVGRFGRDVSAVGRFGPGGGGYSQFSAYVDLDPASRLFT